MDCDVLEQSNQLIINRHPLVLEEAVEWHDAQFLPGECLGEYIIRNKVDLPAGFLTVLVNHQAQHNWAFYTPKPDDIIIISSRAAGAGAKKVGRIIGLVAVAAAGIATAGLVTPILGSIAGGVAAGVVMAGGSLLINSLLPTPKLQKPAVEDKKESPTYGINGGRNRINQYGPMALVFGKHKMVPYLGAKPYVTFQWEDNFYHQIFHFGLQPDLIVDDMRIGDNPISNYQGVQIERSDQYGGIYSIAGNVDMQEGFTIRNSDGWIERRGPEDTTTISVDISATLFQVDTDSGAFVYNFSLVQIQYRKVGTQDWLQFGPGVNGPDPGGYQLFGFDPNKPVRVIAQQDVERGQYDIRFWKPAADQDGSTQKNETAISLIRFYQADDTDYTGQLRYGITIKASGQLQNTVDELSAIVSARCNVWTGDSWDYRETSNPAWWLLWFARGKRDANGDLIYGEGLTDDQIDIDAIKAWARFCDDKKLTFNWILDRQMKVSEVLATIARAGRATTSRSIGKRTVVWDAADKPTQYMLTPANVVEGSFEISYINQDIVDVIEANFTNADLDYKADTVRQRVPNTPITDNPITIDLEGVTNADQAGREVNLIAADQWFHKRQYSWQMDVEGAVMRKGEVVLLAYDFHSYQYSGRIVSVDPDRKLLTLDGVINGRNVWFVLRDRQGNIATTRVSGNNGKSVILSNWPSISANNDAGARFIPPTPETVNDYLWYAAPQQAENKTLLITAVEPQDEYKIKFTAIDYDSRYYDTEYDLYSHAPRRTLVVKNHILYLVASETRMDDGTVIVRFSWELAQRGSQVYAQINDGEHHESSTTDRTYIDVPSKTGRTVTANISLANGDYKVLSHVVQGGVYPMPAITDVTATNGLVNKIAVQWVMPLKHPSVRVTEVWGAPVNNGQTGARRKLSDVVYPETSYMHFVDGAGVQWRYWVRLVDKQGNAGPYYPAGDGALGSTTSDRGKIIKYLGDNQFDSILGQKLDEPIGDLRQKYDQLNAEIKNTRDTVIKNEIDELESRFNDQVNGKIQDLRQTVANAEQSIANREQQVSSQLGAIKGRVNTAMESVANLDGTANNTFTVKVEQDENGQKYVAGMGVGIDNSKGKTDNYVLFDANNFTLRSRVGGQIVYPFVVQDGQVHINSAMIDKADIGDAAVDRLVAKEAIIAGRNIADGAVSDTIVEQSTYYGLMGQRFRKSWRFDANVRIAIIQVQILNHENATLGSNNESKIVANGRNIWVSDPIRIGEPVTQQPPDWPPEPVMSMLTNLQSLDIDIYPRIEGNFTVEYAIALFKK